MASFNWNQALNLLARYSQLSLPLRMLVSAVITIGAGVGLGFVAEYGAYRWAIYYGLRPPLEGIPFLRVAITGLTVVALVGGAFVFVVVRLVVSALLRQVERLIANFNWYISLAQRISPGIPIRSEALVAIYRTLPVSMAALISIGCGLAVGLVYVATAYRDGDHQVYWAMFVAVTLSVAAAFITLWRADMRNWLALLDTVLVVFVAPLALFSVEVYGRVLRELGYGGGVPVTVHLVDEPNFSGSRTEVQGFLMLRTSIAVILFEPRYGRIREIPMANVLVIDHSSDLLEKRLVELPR